jgi:Holliday junction resolvase RusA-like endonuclease
MTDPIIIRVTGHPVPQGRPRATVIAGHASLYKPAKSRRWEEDARQVARQVMGDRKPWTGALNLSVRFWLALPQSWPEWKRKAAERQTIAPTTKPDLSNLLKAVEDALNGVVWIDDAQVVGIASVKSYGSAPAVEITVSTVASLPAQITRRMDLERGVRG